MPQNYRHKTKKRKSKAGVLLCVTTVGIVLGIIAFFMLNYHDDVKVKMQEINYPRKYSEYVEKAAQDYDLDEALIYAVIRTESKFNPNAKSKAGAYGIMQIMPSSFEWLQKKRGCEGQYTAEDLFNPEICIDYGSYMIKYFYDLYGNEKCAVAAYNAGFVVGNWLKDSNYSTDGKTLSNIPYPETEKYVKKVESAKNEYIKLYYS